jgi:hypothetical protein
MAKPRLDFDQLAQGLGAERRGKVKAKSGYFGASQLAAELARRLRVPVTGGRPTDPTWTERRVVPLRRSTLERLNADADRLGIKPMHLAALLIEQGLETADAGRSRRTQPSRAPRREEAPAAGAKPASHRPHRRPGL